MTEADIEELLAPVSEEAPSGENLEYDPSFSELERAAAGKEERYSGGELIPAEDPDWKALRQLAVDLFGRTKDLRVAVQLVRAETALSGIEGLAGGVAMLKAMLDRYWDSVHPRLEPEDDYDPMFRINALAPLSDLAGLLGVLRKTVLVEARAIGRFTFRDLDIVEERATVAEGEAAPTLELLKAALRDAGSDYAEAAVGRLGQALEGLKAIEAVFQERAKDGQGPDLDALSRMLGYGIAFLKTGIAQAEDTEVGEGEVEATDAAPAGGKGGVGALRSREDVKRILEQVCDFLERTEPSNPAPLLIKRAQRLLDRNFIDIIQDLAPDAFAQIEKLAGNAPAAQAASE